MQPNLVSDLVGDPKDRFSQDAAHMVFHLLFVSLSTDKTGHLINNTITV